MASSTSFVAALALAVLTTVGCGSSGGAGGADDVVAIDAGPGWDPTVDDFVDALCVDAMPCTGDPVAACTTDVHADLMDARAALDDAGEARCLQCLIVRAREMRRIAAAACDLQAADLPAIWAACDLNPNVDYDGDGGINNDEDEACAGFP